jgi:D-xylulose reductase
LQGVGDIRLGDIELPRTLEPAAGEVRIAIKTVGICGSDVHYYKHGRIGDFIVKEPMVLGHEASGIVTAVGANVAHLQVGDRVCMEPGIPDFTSREALAGHYNLDPSVRFWATPPIHGCLTPEVVHPAALTYKLPDAVSMAEGAMVEPLAIGVYAAARAAIRPGDIAVVAGAGTIGMMVALAALASGCSEVIVSDVAKAKLDLIAGHAGIVPVDLSVTKLTDVVAARTAARGADIFFEASGSPRAFDDMMAVVGRGGRVVLIGMPQDRAPLDVVALEVKEISITGIFRYANVWERTLALLASGKIDVKPLISATYPFEQSVAAFERAAKQNASDVKIQIVF